MRAATPDDILPKKALERGVWALDLATATGWAYAPPDAVGRWPADRPMRGMIAPFL